jgi:hypothetical protein
VLKKAISQTEADILELVQTVVTGLVHIVIIDARFSCKAAAERSPLATEAPSFTSPGCSIDNVLFSWPVRDLRKMSERSPNDDAEVGRKNEQSG